MGLMDTATPPKLPLARTRTESLRLQLEQEILSGRLKPGQKLDEEELATAYGMSRTPVREAIKALSSGGLLEFRQHQGAYVAAPSSESIGEMIEVMSVLETACAEMAARRHNISDRSAVAAAQAACEQAVQMHDPAAFYAANVRFHEAIYSAAHNSVLAQQVRAIRVRLEPYRRHITYNDGVLQQSLQEHAGIMAAIFAMKPGQAREAMQVHISALANDIAALAAGGAD